MSLVTQFSVDYIFVHIGCSFLSDFKTCVKCECISRFYVSSPKCLSLKIRNKLILAKIYWGKTTLQKTLKGMFLFFKTKNKKRKKNTQYSIFTVKISSSIVAIWNVNRNLQGYYILVFIQKHLHAYSVHYWELGIYEYECRYARWL